MLACYVRTSSDFIREQETQQPSKMKRRAAAKQAADDDDVPTITNVLESNYFTACDGFEFVKGSLTTKRMSALCQILERYFGFGYTFQPVENGGIMFANWPEKGPGMLKFMRFHLEKLEWPSSITDDTLVKWRQNVSEMICKDLTGGKTSIKAFYGAPCWKRHEVLLFAAAFEAVGIEVKTDKIPKAKKLVLQGDLGLKQHS